MKIRYPIDRPYNLILLDGSWDVQFGRQHEYRLSTQDQASLMSDACNRAYERGYTDGFRDCDSQSKLEAVESWRHDSEELEALHRCLDDQNVARYSPQIGTEYSAWGRVQSFVDREAEQPEQWVKTSEQAPTQHDADEDGDVWAWDGSESWLKPWGKVNCLQYPYWRRSERRPQPPKVEDQE